jgi:nitroreductase
MHLQDAVRLRRSTAAITNKAPDDQQLATYLALAAHAPDHAGLRPWRLVTLRNGDRDRLGAAMSAGFGDEPGSEAARRTAAKPLRAPLLIGIIAAPVPHPKVPAWEQVAAVVAMVTTLELVLFDAGWTAFWRSGPATELSQTRLLMGATGTEQLLGWLYVGATADTNKGGTLATQPDPDITGGLVPLSDLTG